MGAKSLLSVVVVSATLLGCASSPPAPQGFDPKDDQIECKGNRGSADCGVEVAVNRGCALFSNCLNVKKGQFVVITGGATPTITWTLRGSDADDFEFDPGENGQPIKFLNDADDFSCKPAREKPVKVVTCDKRSSSPEFRIYKYQISGRPFKGLHAPVTPLDPWVINK